MNDLTEQMGKLSQQVDTLTAQVGNLTDQVGNLTQQRDDLTAEVAVMKQHEEDLYWHKELQLEDMNLQRLVIGLPNLTIGETPMIRVLNLTNNPQLIEFAGFQLAGVQQIALGGGYLQKVSDNYLPDLQQLDAGTFTYHSVINGSCTGNNFGRVTKLNLSSSSLTDFSQNTLNTADEVRLGGSGLRTIAGNNAASTKLMQFASMVFSTFANNSLPSLEKFPTVSTAGNLNFTGNTLPKCQSLAFSASNIIFSDNDLTAL